MCLKLFRNLRDPRPSGVRRPTKYLQEIGTATKQTMTSSAITATDCRLNAMELVHEDLQCGTGRDCWPRLAGDAVPRGIKRPAAALILSRLLFDAPRSPTEPLQAIQRAAKVFTAFRNCSRPFETSSTLDEEARSRSKLFEAIRGRSKLIEAPRASPLKFILERLSKLPSKSPSKLLPKPF